MATDRSKDFAGIEFGILEDSTSMRIRNFSGKGKGNSGAFAGRLQKDLQLYTRRVTASLAKRLQQAIRAEFIAGRDKDGDSHNKTGATLKTLKVEGGGLHFIVKMSGGGPFVQYRQPPHVIKPKNQDAGYPLKWFDKQDMPHYARVVKHPGYKGDDFIGRAVRRTALEKRLSQLALGAHIEESGMGNSYGPYLAEIKDEIEG